MKTTLGDIFEIGSGGTPSKIHPEYYGGNIPWVKTGDLKEEYLYSVEDHITEEGLNNSSAKMYPPGTVLIAMYGATIGATSILRFDACTNQACAAFKPCTEVKPEYLYYFLRSKKQKFISDGVGGAQPNISAGYLKKVCFDIRSSAEQEKIVSNLDKINGIIQKRQRELLLLDELIKARFVEMFGDPVSNPKGWPMPIIEDVVSPEKNALKAGPFGSSLKKEYYVQSGYKIYGQEQVISGDPNYGDYYINEEKYKQLENCAVQAGDVLISLVGTYGKLLVMPESFEPGIINPRLMKITFDRNKVNPYYFQYYFQSDSLKKSLADNTHGGTMDILNLGIVRKLKIPLPPIELQNEFVALVNQVDKSKAVVRKSIDENLKMFDSLMQRYFG